MPHPDGQASYEFEDLRIQALSPTLVRLERRGPRGFEDRPTFHVLERSWPGAPLRREDTEAQVLLHGDHWTVWLPRTGADLEQVRITGADGALLYAWAGPVTSARELPAPGEFPQAWVLGDVPRLVPPPWGATPAPRGRLHLDTSGWDLGNDALDLYVFLPRGDYLHLRAELLRLTGHTELPPLYLFGAWHSRYFPYTDRGALSVIREYRERGFPLDVFMVDTHWRVSASYGYEINPHLFPDFPGFLDQAHQLGVRVGINDHPKAIARSAVAPRELAYRYANLARFLWLGVDFWWFDRNWNVCLTGPTPLLCKEVWGMRVFSDMTRKAVPGRRPLILANVDGIDDGRYLGPPDIASHRFACQWTGDTRLSWETLRQAVVNAVRAGVHSLVPYISDDVGTHEGMPSAEFYLRHWQYAALSAVLRPHASSSLYFRREPWAFGPEVEALALAYARMRYRLLPYLYAAARCNHDTGMPLLRRLDLAFPAAPEAAGDDQYLLGAGLLVAPILEGEACNPLVPSAWLRSGDGRPGLQVELFPNENLLGPPTATWREPQVQLDWSLPAPARPTPAPFFSVRWTGTLTPSCPAQVGLKMAEGGRLYLDDQLVFDHWTQDQWLHSRANHGLHLMTLQPGRSYRLRVEARHRPGAAHCQLFYRPMGLPREPRARSVWLPEGPWIDAWTGARHQGPIHLQAQAGAAILPLYLRAGTLIPLAPEMRHSDERPWDPITLDLYPHADHPATGELYEDDRWSNGYLQGCHRRTALSAEMDPRAGRITIRIGAALGPYQGAPRERSWVLRIHRPPEIRAFGPVQRDGQASVPWTLHPPGTPATPFQDQGPALDGEVLEVRLSASSIAEAQTVTVDFH